MDSSLLNEKKRLYLHIGMHKTGTTAIQNFLFQNHSSLKDNNLLYYSNNCAIDYRFALAFKDRTDFEYVIRSLEEIKKAREENIILSCEVFLEEDHIAGLLYEYLTQNGILEQFDVKIIVYIRRQDCWLESAYNQITKSYNWRRLTFEEFLLTKELESYQDRIFLWENVFGTSNMIVRPYLENVGQDWLFNDFLSILGLELSNDYIRPSGCQLNRSVDITIIHSISVAKEYFASQTEIDQFIGTCSTFGNINSDNKLIPLNIRKEIIEQHRTFNLEVAGRFFHREEPLFSEDIIDDEKCLIENELGVQAIKMLSKVIIDQNRINDLCREDSQEDILLELEMNKARAETLNSEVEMFLEKLVAANNEVEMLREKLVISDSEVESLISEKKAFQETYAYRFHNFMKRFI